MTLTVVMTSGLKQGFKHPKRWRKKDALKAKAFGYIVTDCNGHQSVFFADQVERFEWSK